MSTPKSKNPPPGADAFFCDMLRQYAARYENRKTSYALWKACGGNSTPRTFRRHLSRMAMERKIQAQDGLYWAPPWHPKEDAESP